MSNKPLISIITCFFNAEMFFEETIKSVFAQTYDYWELILIDDGSIDNSTQIALHYAKKNSDKVKYLEHQGHQNFGQSASRNLGIQNARGNFIAFLDADDIWLPQKLEKEINIFAVQPEAGMVYSSTLTWFSWTGNPKDIERDWIRTLECQPDTLVRPPTLLKHCLQRKALPPCPSSVMIRRELIEEVGGFEESIQRMFEDQVLFAKIGLKAPIFFISCVLVKYRQHSNSICAVVEKAGQYGTELSPYEFAYLSWLKNYLKKQGIIDSGIWRALQKRLLPHYYPNLYRLSRIIRNLSKTSTKSQRVIQ
jgi:glycosyltransferase involved in cell wall biosynthesis